MGVAHAAESVCATGRRVVAACYDVHGRLRVNANSRVYLWPVGTKRLLDVALTSDATDSGFFLPVNAANLVGPETDVFGDFRVCPFTPEIEGRMRMGCVAAASNLVTRTRNP